MVNLQYMMSEDCMSATIELQADAKFSAPELEEFMRVIAVLRASMKPPVSDEDPTPQTLFSSIACTRWYVNFDQDAPTQLRLYLLHPGFGWIWIPLNEPAIVLMTALMQQGLQSRPKLQ